MEWFLLLIGMLGVLGIILTIKACLAFKPENNTVVERESIAVSGNDTGSSYQYDNVIPFPQKKRGSRVEGISDELWDRWVEVCDMDHSRKRADLLLELMNDTVRHAHGQDRKDD